jgi:proton glutamate symport protein
MKILNNGYTTLLATFFAIIVGFLFPELGKMFMPFSELFLILISISIIPIIFSSVTCSFITLLTESTTNIKISRVLILFTLTLVMAAIIGIGFSLLNANSINAIYSIDTNIFDEMSKSIPELSLDEALKNVNNFHISNIFSILLPSNPFAAFANGNVIQTLSLSILVGISISKLDVQMQERTLNALNLLLELFKKILKLATTILPIGIFFLLASCLCNIKIESLVAMKEFFVIVLLSFSLIIVISFMMILIYSPAGIWKSIQALKNPITIAFSTRSNQATLPFLTSALVEKFGLSDKVVNLVIPLGVTLCRVSNVCYYAFITIFISFLYNTPLSILQYIIVILGAIIVSLAASGSSGVIAVSMISLILAPLQLPLEAILPALITIEPIIEPLRAVTNLIANAAIACVVISKKPKKQCA